MAFTMKKYTIGCCEELSAEPDKTCNTDFCETQCFLSIYSFWHS